MISALTSLVQCLAKRFNHRGIPYEDLIQIGTLGLVKAINSFDRTKGVEFGAFATHYIVRAIKHHLPDNG